jgi:hypothetical protein
MTILRAELSRDLRAERKSYYPHVTMRASCFGGIASVLLVVAPAFAQSLPSAAVFSATASEGVSSSTNGAVDRLLRARLDELHVVRVQSGVSLDLGEAQLALGCIGETAECLRPIAEQIEVDVLVLPSLDRAGGEQVLGILLFDSRDGSLRRAVRRTRDEVELLDTIEGALRELFGLPPPPPEHRDSHSGTVQPPSGPDLLGPSILLGTGGAALVVAAITGGLFLGESSAYSSAPAPTNEAEALALESRLSSANTLAITTDVLFVVGGAAAVGGAIWLIVALVSGSSAPTARVSPAIGPGFAGAILSGEM